MNVNHKDDAKRAFAEALRKYDKIALAGGPRSGKSTLTAAVADRPVIHTDDYMELPWSELPPAVLALPELGGDRWVIEGVQVGRVLRKGLQPDVVLWLGGSHGELSKGQRSMVKGCETVFKDWLRNFRPDGVEVEYLGE